MPYNIPGTQELVDRNIAGIESALNTVSQPAARSFNKTWAAVEAMQGSGLYAYARDRALDNLAISASEEGLERIGEEYDVPRREATAWRGKAAFSLNHTLTLYVGTVFIGPQGIKYRSTQTVIAGGDNTAIVNLSCMESGPSGNLSNGDILISQSVIDGAGREAVVLSVAVHGFEKENIEEYRTRVLDAIRGGAAPGDIPACVTASDYRIVSEAVGGVARAFPFTGPPVSLGGTAVPGQRTVYIECTPDIEPDGIPPQSLLDIVRGAIKTDPLSGNSREMLGLPCGNELLFVEPIERKGIYVTITGLSVHESSFSDAKSQITEAVKKFLALFAPFVQGLDAEFDRRDELTNSVLSREVQNALDVFGGTAEGVTFGDTPNTNLGKFTLANNQKLRFAGIVFRETV